MLPGIVNTLLIDEPALSRAAPRMLREAVVEPFHEFITRSGWRQAPLVLGFIFPTSSATAWRPRWRRRSSDIGFTMSEIGLIAKNAGLWASVLGGLLGGIWMLRSASIADCGCSARSRSSRSWALRGSRMSIGRTAVACRRHRRRGARRRAAPPRSPPSSRAPPIRATRRHSSRCSRACRCAAFADQCDDWVDCRCHRVVRLHLLRCAGLPGMALLLRVAPWNAPTPGAEAPAPVKA
jgi:hypothetical protein